ncbi:MAG: signal peptide peptidase SppA [Acidobacteria bacterium]|nr:signal peptide peptidase SppA [Acidobacteriota bacterium]
MKKFLLGILAGLIIAVVSSVVIFFGAVKFANRPPDLPAKAWLALRVEGELPEAPPVSFPLPALEARSPLTVAEMWSVLRRAARDPHIQGVVLKPRGLAAGWGKIEEIRAGIETVRKAGKPVYAWLASPGMREYYLASAADKVFVTPEDIVDVKGLRIEATYLKGTLDKLGVEAEVEHIGKYKDAGDAFTRTGMSPESKEALNAILDELYGRLCAGIGSGRRLAPEKVRALLDEGPFLAPKAKDAGLVDGLEYERDVEKMLAEKVGLDATKSVSARQFLQGSGALESKKTRSIAYLVAQGDILRGAAAGLFGEDRSITPRLIERQAKLIGDDPSIKGVILRIDSPGGDAIASDEILSELRKLARKKPLVISMSDVAASGGYYIAMTGDPLIAYPQTVTGSIGVIYGKANLAGLYEKVGISKEVLQRGRFADIDSDFRKLSPEGRAKLRESLQFIYDGFIRKVAAGRRRKASDIEPLAQGRVWIGAHARQNGLVDEVGGLDKAVELLRPKAGLGPEDQVRLVLFPGQRTLLDEIFRPVPETESGSVSTEVSMLVRQLPPGVAPWLAGGILRVMPYQLSFR